MHIPVIGFIPPVAGVDKEFNTFRLGLKLSKTLQVGSKVFLMDEKAKIVFGSAEVTDIVSGELGELCLLHAATNHRELANDPIGAPERLYKYIEKLFGPHIVNPKKNTTVVFMRRLE
ncbi:MAG: hypothetical protein WKG03_08885 [Telluria sp.]